MLIKALSSIVVADKNNRITYHKGDSFEIDDREANRLIALRSAEEVTDYVVVREDEAREAYSEDQLKGMTKQEIAIYGEQFGLEMNDGLTKDALINRVLNAMEETGDFDEDA